jgi:hypothetical protein
MGYNSFMYGIAAISVHSNPGLLQTAAHRIQMTNRSWAHGKTPLLARTNKITFINRRAATLQASFAASMAEGCQIESGCRLLQQLSAAVHLGEA